jgi:hypothetical protein
MNQRLNTGAKYSKKWVLQFLSSTEPRLLRGVPDGGHGSARASGQRVLLKKSPPAAIDQ